MMLKEADSQADFRRGALGRWYFSYCFFGVPQAAGPIAFALLALRSTGDAANGAAIVMAMTVAQVVGAVPIARLGRSHNAFTFLRILIGIRSLALTAIAVLAVFKAPFYLMVVMGVFGGLVNGAAYGYMRSVLNYLVEPPRLLKALGIGATINELTFVVAPVLASVVGTISPTLAILAMTVLGAAPIFLIRRVAHARVPPETGPAGTLINRHILLWLWCSAAGGSAVAVIEVGSISLAVDFGFRPGLGVIFTVALCIASVTGGIWVSVRNRMAHRATVPFLLATMTTGISLVALRQSPELSAAGCVLVGLVMAPLSTHYSLVLDDLAPPGRKAEIFALLRTANSLGIILASAMLVWTALLPALMAAATALAIAATAVTVASLRPALTVSK